MNNAITKHRAARQFIVLLLSTLALLAFSLELLRFFDRPFDSVRPDVWARAPYSDALAPWLVGSLYYLFDLPQIHYLYRPSVGLFWAAIIAATGKIWLIPQVLAAGFVAFLAAIVWLVRNNRLGLILALFLSLFSATAQLTLSPLLINTLYIDFAALIFTVAGTWLLLVSCNQGGWIGPATASMLLGIAAAIRGPMMLGGPVLIALILGWSAGRSRKLWLSCLAVFALVVSVDVILQRAHQTANNGIESLYCVATDETRSWSPECSARYNRTRPPPRQVIDLYVDSITTVEGFSSVTSGMERRLADDLKVFEQIWVRIIIIAAFVSLALSLTLSLTRRRRDQAYSTGDSWGARSVIADSLPAISVLVLLAATAALGALGAPSDAVAIMFAGCLLLIAGVARQRLAISLIASYIACVVFLALLGYAAAHPRFAGTFSFLILLAVSVLLLPRHVLQTDTVVHIGELRLVAATVLLSLSFLYLGSRLWPSDLRDTFAKSVRNQQAALKLSYEPLLDRALYITGAGGVLYTLGDTVTIGDVRRFSAVRYLDRYGNVSLLQPNEFID